MTARALVRAVWAGVPRHARHSVTFTTTVAVGQYDAKEDEQPTSSSTKTLRVAVLDHKEVVEDGRLVRREKTLFVPAPAPADGWEPARGSVVLLAAENWRVADVQAVGGPTTAAGWTVQVSR